jgi:hypothetical protein
LDGGIMSSPWRDRTQSTDPACAAAQVVSKFTLNVEVVEFVLSQIADTYNPYVAMVAASSPSPAHTAPLYIPLQHLQFCMTVANLLPTSHRIFRNVVHPSLVAWKTL